MLKNNRLNREELIAKIEAAFAGVTLEDGVGLHEGQGLDDYLSEEECARLRMKDETQDWYKIPILDLYLCHTSLFYFDAKGMRFHLPQILLWALGVYYEEDERLFKEDLLRYGDPPSILFALTHLDKNWYRDYYFSALNREQIECCFGISGVVQGERRFIE